MHARLHLGPNRIADHVLTEEQRAIRRKVDVRKSARRKLLATLHPAVAVNVEHHELLTIEGPEHSLRIELESADEMRGIAQEHFALGLEVRTELQNATTTGVIVLRVIE